MDKNPAKEQPGVSALARKNNIIYLPPRANAPAPVAKSPALDRLLKEAERLRW